jgi:AsmA family
LPLIPLEGLRRLDLDLEIRLDAVEGASLAIGHTQTHLTLDNGRLRLSPWQFNVVGGHAEVNAEVDAREPVPQRRLEAETDDVQLANGELDLVLDLQASGRSPRDLAGSLSGDLGLAPQRGQIRSRLFGLTTKNPLRWLVALNRAMNRQFPDGVRGAEPDGRQRCQPTSLAFVPAALPAILERAQLDGAHLRQAQLQGCSLRSPWSAWSPL